MICGGPVVCGVGVVCAAVCVVVVAAAGLYIADPDTTLPVMDETDADVDDNDVDDIDNVGVSRVEGRAAPFDSYEGYVNCLG